MTANRPSIPLGRTQPPGDPAPPSNPRPNRHPLLLGLILIWFGVVLSACNGSAQFQGSWRGDRDIPVPPGKDTALAATIGRVRLEIKPNGTFTLVEAGMPKFGRVRYADGNAYLRIERIMHDPIEKLSPSVARENHEIVLRLQRDGTLLYHDPRGFDPEPLVLRRETKP